MKTNAKTRKTPTLITLLILIPLGILFLKKQNKESNAIIVKNSVVDVKKQLLQTYGDFIPDIDERHFLDNILKENLFTAKTKFDLINNNTDNDYKSEISFIRNSKTREEDIQFSIIQNNKDIFDLNWIYGGDYSYIYSPGIYTKYIKINPHHLGKEYLESYLKNNSVNTRKMTQLNIDPFSYPSDLNDVEKLYNSYFEEYYTDILKEDNIIKNEGKDRDYYQLEIDNTTFKELLLTHTYFAESLYYKYNENIFAKVDPLSNNVDEYFTKLRENITKKYNNEKDKYILTFTLKGKNLSSMDIFKNKKSKEDELLRIGFYGDKNITDIIKITCLGNVIYNHSMDKNVFIKDFNLKDKYVYIKSEYDKDSKTLNSALLSNTIKSDIDLTITGSNNKGFDLDINMFNY